jgi:hypothetical protein
VGSNPTLSAAKARRQSAEKRPPYRAARTGVHHSLASRPSPTRRGRTFCRRVMLQVVFIFTNVPPMSKRAMLGACLSLAGLAAAGGGCNSSAAADGDGGCVEFIAPSDPATAFNGFCNWHSAPAMNSEDAGDGIHAPGPLTVYWNNSPTHGSTSFPIGTIIIKEPTQITPGTQAFAMVKRGCGYNEDEAKNWEWWSLADNGDCTMTMLWRGPAAPAGETYSGKPVGDCNGCHGMVVDNDYVWDTALQLSNF